MWIDSILKFYYTSKSNVNNISLRTHVFVIFFSVHNKINTELLCSFFQQGHHVSFMPIQIQSDNSVFWHIIFTLIYSVNILVQYSFKEK